METAFGFGKKVSTDFETTIDKVTEALGDEGFGVLTEIDVAATLKKKLDVDMPRYRILGACNPGLAHQAVSAVPEIGLLLPCNVLVREDDAGDLHVSFMNPESVLGMVGEADVAPLARTVKAKLEKAMQELD